MRFTLLCMFCACVALYSRSAPIASSNSSASDVQEAVQHIEARDADYWKPYWYIDGFSSARRQTLKTQGNKKCDAQAAKHGIKRLWQKVETAFRDKFTCKGSHECDKAAKSLANAATLVVKASWDKGDHLSAHNNLHNAATSALDNMFFKSLTDARWKDGVGPKQDFSNDTSSPDWSGLTVEMENMIHDKCIAKP